jgi:hypothetical protein
MNSLDGNDLQLRDHSAFLKPAISRISEILTEHLAENM